MRQRIYWYMAFSVMVLLIGANLAHAQSGIQPVFTPAISQKLDKLSTHAKATSDDESSMNSKGYVKIGTIRASQPGTKEDPEITRLLESAILQKAAEVGGEYVHFSKEGSFEQKDVPTGKTKTKHRKCEKYITGILNGKPILECVSWSVGDEVSVTRRETNLVSEGTVWRYAPKMAAIGALFDAAARGQKSDVESLLAQGVDVNARDEQSRTPLFIAIINGHGDVAEVLLAHGADVNVNDKYGDMPLINAVVHHNRDMTEILLAHGADANVKDKYGDMPLINAVRSDYRDVAEVLLAHGADVNAADTSGWTPLKWAIFNKDQALIDLLRQHGADIARKAEPEEARKAVTGAAIAPSMLGKNINSAEMKTWLSSLGKPEILRSRLTESYYYNFKSKGISLFFNNANDTLRGIIFYSEGADDYRQFQGDLPFGLSFQNTRSEIESILGPPDKTDDGAGTNIWTSYNSKGIRIKYNTVRTDDMNARMYFIIINTVP
jgi:hypothetical protein